MKIIIDTEIFPEKIINNSSLTDGFCLEEFCGNKATHFLRLNILNRKYLLPICEDCISRLDKSFNIEWMLEAKQRHKDFLASDEFKRQVNEEYQKRLEENGGKAK